MSEESEQLVILYESALRAISGPLDDPSGLDWRMRAYRGAGGGYEGLQAIADAALAAGMTSEALSVEDDNYRPMTKQEWELARAITEGDFDWQKFAQQLDEVGGAFYRLGEQMAEALRPIAELVSSRSVEGE